MSNKEHKLRIFLSCSEVANCGVAWYRMVSPLQQLEKKGLIELRVIDFNYGEKAVEVPFKVKGNSKEFGGLEVERRFQEAYEWADLVYICRDETPNYISLHGGCKMFYEKRDNRKIPLILDIDDYVQFTRPHNPGYLSFNPNSIFNSLNLKLLEVVDGITCSTDYLKDVYKKVNKKMFVCPNSLDLDWRGKADATPIAIKKKKDEIRIGWAGSAAHYENLKILQRPLQAIMEKYPNVTFHYTGLFGGLFQGFGNRVRTVKFSKFRQWPEKLKSMGLDIALAPLADNHFNRAKSNLRVLEYWAAKFPVIASSVLPYKFIKDGVDGLLAEEEWQWYDAIEKLILDEQKRKELVENGYKRLKAEYDIEKNCLRWLEVFKKYIK